MGYRLEGMYRPWDRTAGVSGMCFGGREMGCLGFLGWESFSLRMWLRYVAGLWSFECRLRDVEVNGSGVYSWCWDVFICHW